MSPPAGERPVYSVAMGTPAAPDRGRLHILVVEDDDTIGRHLETGLRVNGYASAWSRTGASALTETDPHRLRRRSPGPRPARPRRTGPRTHPARPPPRPADRHPHRPYRRHRRHRRPGRSADDYLVKPSASPSCWPASAPTCADRPARRSRSPHYGSATWSSTSRPAAAPFTTRRSPCGRRSSTSSPCSPRTPAPPSREKR